MLCFLLCKKHSIFASNAFLHQMLFCTAEHFPKENVQHQQNVRAASNAFDAYILLVQKCIFAKQNVTNAFDAKMHFGNATHQQNVRAPRKRAASNTFLHSHHSTP